MYERVGMAFANFGTNLWPYGSIERLSWERKAARCVNALKWERASI